MAKSKSVTIYGIKNCDTMKKARTWLDDHGVAYAFHDYKAEGIDKASLERWAKEVSWEILLNRAGTTFRACRKRKEGVNGEEGDRVDAGAAEHDQAAGAGCRRQADRCLQARNLRKAG
jgi:glutaredoxin